jgi:hypothetical protein
MRPPYDEKLAFAGLSTSNMIATGHNTIRRHITEGSTAMGVSPFAEP